MLLMNERCDNNNNSGPVVGACTCRYQVAVVERYQSVPLDVTRERQPESRHRFVGEVSVTVDFTSTIKRPDAIFRGGVEHRLRKRCTRHGKVSIAVVLGPFVEERFPYESRFLMQYIDCRGADTCAVLKTLCPCS